MRGINHFVNEARDGAENVAKAVVEKLTSTKNFLFNTNQTPKEIERRNIALSLLRAGSEVDPENSKTYKFLAESVTNVMMLSPSKDGTRAQQLADIASGEVRFLGQTRGGSNSSGNVIEVEPSKERIEK